MIVMINGAFGVGKTTLAKRLASLIPDSMIYDPEEVGFMLRNIIPDQIMEEAHHDFQNVELWRRLTVHVADELKTRYHKHLIVPMTIHDEENFEYIFNGFQRIDPETYHFCLTASKETIYNRLIERGESVGSWAFQQTDRCLNAYQSQRYRTFIDTEKKSSDEISASIVHKLQMSDEERGDKGVEHS